MDLFRKSLGSLNEMATRTHFACISLRGKLLRNQELYSEAETAGSMVTRYITHVDVSSQQINVMCFILHCFFCILFQPELCFETSPVSLQVKRIFHNNVTSKTVYYFEM